MESRDIAPTLFFLVLPVSLVLLYLQVSAIRLSRRRGHIPSPSLHIASVFFVALTAIICSTIAIIGTIAYVERADTSRTTRYQLGEEVSTDFLKLLRKLETFVLPTITLRLTERNPKLPMLAFTSSHRATWTNLRRARSLGDSWLRLYFDIYLV